MANHLLKRVFTRRATDRYGVPYQETCPECGAMFQCARALLPVQAGYEVVRYACGTEMMYHHGLLVKTDKGKFCSKEQIDYLEEEE